MDVEVQKVDSQQLINKLAPFNDCIIGASLKEDLFEEDTVCAKEAAWTTSKKNTDGRTAVITA